MNEEKPKKHKGIAKTLTLGMLCIGFMLGIILLCIPSFDMGRYTEWVKAFAYLYTPLIASIGISSGIDKYKNGTQK